jgi:type II secretory pathway component GspD/PulD (secretin)
MLAKKVNANWRDAPIAQVLQDLEGETGVTIVVDPEMLQSQVLLTNRVYLQSHGATAEGILRSVTVVANSTYILADGEVQILPRNKALAYTIQRSRQPPELGLRATVVRPIRLADIPDFINAASNGVWSARTNRTVIEKLPPPSMSTPDYLQSGRAFRAEIDRVLKPAENRDE